MSFYNSFIQNTFSFHCILANAPTIILYFNTKEDFIMDKYECVLCGYVYDPEVGDAELGIEPGISFDELPEDFTCPLCGAGKDEFEVIE